MCNTGIIFSACSFMQSPAMWPSHCQDLNLMDNKVCSVQTVAISSTSFRELILWIQLFYNEHSDLLVTNFKSVFLRNDAVNFTESCAVNVKWLIIKVDKQIFNSDDTLRSYSDLCFLASRFVTLCTFIVIIIIIISLLHIVSYVVFQRLSSVAYVLIQRLAW